MRLTTRMPTRPIATPSDAADEALHERLAGDLADDAAVAPADRLQRAELAGAAGDARDGEQDRDEERGGEHE